MVSKKVVLILILTSLLCLEIVEAGPEKQRRNTKHKKTPQNEKLKGTFKQASALKTSRRNGKTNYYTSKMWPTTTTYYRPSTTSSLYLRSHLTASSSIYYPMQWSDSFISPSSLMASNTLRRKDDFSTSSPLVSAKSSVITMPTLKGPVLPMTNSPMPTLYDMSAFTGNAGLMEHALTNSNENLWSLGETVTGTSKPKINLFNRFNYNDDAGWLDGFLNQFL